MQAPVDFQRICSSMGGNPDPGLRSAGESSTQQHQRVSRSCHMPKVSSPASCRGGIRTWAASTVPGSFPAPSPASPTPALSSHPGKLLLGAVPGEAAAVCRVLPPCLCLPGAREGFTLPLSLCCEGAKSKSGH